MKFEDALKIQNSRVCSDCYGPVICVRNRATGEYDIQCSTPGCLCRGTISRHTLYRRQAENAAEAHDARETLKKAVPWLDPNRGKSETDLLKELGF